MRALRALAAACVLAAAPARAGDPAPVWEPVPQEAWALRDRPELKDRGAVVLLHHIRVNARTFTVVRRVRVLSERGKEAVLSPRVPARGKVSGRVVLPDGTERPFDETRDVLVKHEILWEGRASEGRRLVPAGVTSDCIVDLRWEWPAPWKDKAERYALHHESWDLAEPYPIARLVLDLAGKDGIQWVVQAGSWRYETSQQGDDSRFVFRDMPALDPVPFTLEPALDVPRLRMESVAWAATQGGDRQRDVFWTVQSEAVLWYLKPFKDLAWNQVLHEDQRRTQEYDALSTALRSNLPPGRQAAAAELWHRLDARIINVEAPRAEGRVSAKVLETLSPRDLSRVAKAGATTSLGMSILYLALLRDAGIPARPVMAFDRRLTLYDPEVTSTIGTVLGIVRVDEEGRPPLLVETGLHLAPAGLVRPFVQANGALALGEGRESLTRFTVPMDEARANTRQETYHLVLQGEELAFSMERRLEGQEAWALRNAMGDQVGADLEGGLRQSLVREASSSEGVQLVRVACSGMQDPRQPLRVTAEGRLDAGSGATRILRPFPLTAPALDAPAVWPVVRKEPIVLPWRQVRTATSTLPLPAGWTWTPTEPVARENGFGRVTWKTTREGDVLTTVLTVEVRQSVAKASQQPALKDFLAWIGEASRLSLRLERQP